MPLNARARAAARAVSPAAIAAEWQGWLAEHQATRDAIDPYVAVLDCP